MCSIMGYTAKDIRLEDLRKGFDKTVSRGPDMSRTLETPAGWLFFHRLAIMGLTEEGMQPFRAGRFRRGVCNGELYGFRSVKEELRKRKATPSQVDSDCEILLPLYEEVWHRRCSPSSTRSLPDHLRCRELIASSLRATLSASARSSTGTSKSGHIVFASEAKNLVGLCERVYAVPAGPLL